MFWFYHFAWHSVIGRIITDKSLHELRYFFDPLSISQYILFPSVFYFNYFVILPRLYKKRKIALSWLSWILLLASFILVRYLVQEVWFPEWLGINNYSPGTSIAYYIYDNIYFGGVLIIISVLFWVLNDNACAQEERYLLMQEKKSAQLTFLKNQVNPHFIFNTLNNIYALVSTRSDMALPSIEKLSHLMRYMYKESDAGQVSVVRELEYISSFIDLQTIRLRNKDSVQYTCCGVAEGQTIAPLLLIPFVENMFKHGILNQPEKPLQARIRIDGERLQLYTANHINTRVKDDASGIGLENVQKRLALLYPGQHSLIIRQHNGIYECTLDIKLNHA